MRVTALGLLVLCSLSVCSAADRVDDYMQTQMQSRHIPGAALAVIHDGELVKAQTYGLANIEWNQPVTRSSPFWLDSLTKLITAAGVMELAAGGQLSLTDSITRYLPDAPAAWKPVTVRHLLAHQSGIKDSYWELYKGSALVHYDPKDIYRYALQQPLQFTPGERCEYSNEGYYLLGVIIERVTHTPYTRWITQHVLEPAGMKTATLYNPWAIIPHMVYSYSLQNGEVVHNREDILSDRGEAIASWGAYASLDDMIAFDAALGNGRLVTGDTLDTMWTNARLNGGEPGRAGLGFDSVLYYRGHRWAAKGGQAGVVYARFPEDHLTIVLLTNMEDVGLYDMIPAIAAMYIPNLQTISSLKPQADPDPGRTARIRQALNDVAAGTSPSPRLTEAVNAEITPEARAAARSTATSTTAIPSCLTSSPACSAPAVSPRTTSSASTPPSSTLSATWSAPEAHSCRLIDFDAHSPIGRARICTVHLLGTRAQANKTPCPIRTLL